jgi:hypothetical protein
VEEIPIYDEWMDGQGTTLTTSVETSSRLAAADQLGLQVNVAIGGRAPTSFTLTLYHSQDGFRWFPKYRNQTTGAAIPQLSVTTFTVNTLNVLSWTEAWPAPPSMRFVQVQLVLNAPVGCRVTILTLLLCFSIRQNARRGNRSCVA